ncbi:MAG: hypothetical protein NTW79_03920 [Candidatus Berkelbacteria bacterium]|nr:hypothetical protein [Candidatus Berkelbacteria bacterium]
MTKLEINPIVFLTIDSWGYSQNFAGNAIHSANPEVFNLLCQNFFFQILESLKNATAKSNQASLESGRIILPEKEKIAAMLFENSFEKNPCLEKIIKKISTLNSRLLIFADTKDKLSNNTISAIKKLAGSSGIADEKISISSELNLEIENNDGVLILNFGNVCLQNLALRILSDGKIFKKISVFASLLPFRFPPAIEKNILTIFPDENPTSILNEVIAENNLNQFLISNSSLVNVEAKITDAVNSKKYVFVRANISDLRQAVETESFGQVVKAIKKIDQSLAKIFTAVLKNSGVLIITAAIGGGEQMIENSKRKNFIPFVIAGEKFQKKVSNFVPSVIKSKGTVADIAPTILDILKIEKPTAMTGESLIK